MNIKELIKYPYETEWLEFKTNFSDPIAIGEYISALSNSAAYHGKNTAFLIWGIDDKTKKVVGTTFNFYEDVNGEPLDHFLARQIKPSIPYRFNELYIEDRRIVVLEIPKADKIPVTFKSERFIRIGSSKERLSKFPERESYFWSVLRIGQPNMVNTEASYQDLTFDKLLIYYAAKGFNLNPKTLEKNLRLRTDKGRYNRLAQVLADENNITVRVAIFAGKSKADKLFSVKEFGNTCIFYAMDKVLEYMDVINIIQADERNRVVERKDVPFFNSDALREAIINAFVHNLWVGGNAPQFTVYTDRIEIVSHGGLPSDQTFEGFFSGESRPVNEELSVMFLQLRISERSGRGVPKVIQVYGKEAYKFTDQSITVTIPFDRINILKNEQHSTHTESKIDIKLNPTQKAILEELRDNPNTTIAQLKVKLNLSVSGITKNLKILRNYEMIERIGSDRKGYWEVK